MTVRASNFAPRPNDFYETEPWAVEALVRALVQLELWQPDAVIWEPAAGNHAIAKSLKRAGAAEVLCSDIHTYHRPQSFLFDFTSDDAPSRDVHDAPIITNPPYGRQNRLAVRFAEIALARTSGYVALLLTAKFDFGITRKHLFRDCPRFRARVALLDRVSWAGNDKTGTEDHAWFIWGPAAAQPRPPVLLYGVKTQHAA